MLSKRKARFVFSRWGFGLVLLLLFGMVGGMWLGKQALSAEQGGRKRVVLLRTDLDGIDGKQLIMVRSEWAPGTVGRKHTAEDHRVHYVLEGTGINLVEGKPPVTLNPGDAWYESPGLVHAIENASKTKPFKFLVVRIANKE